MLMVNPLKGQAQYEPPFAPRVSQLFFRFQLCYSAAHNVCENLATAQMHFNALMNQIFRNKFSATYCLIILYAGIHVFRQHHLIPLIVLLLYSLVRISKGLHMPQIVGRKM